MAGESLTLDRLTDEQKELLASPYGFGRFFLGLPIMDCAERRKVGECRDGDTLFYEIFENDKQRQVVDALTLPGAKVTAATANGAGKTTILIPTAVLWAMALHPRTKVVVTSGVERQVRGQLFPALKSRQGRLQGWTFHDNQIAAPNGSMCIGFSTNDGGRFEGWHGNKDPFYDLLQHDGPLMIVVDEAKSVAPSIFDAIDRCTYQWLLQVSSCGGSSGEFWKSHNAYARFFRTFRITAGDCPHADHDKNRELILKRGINDPLVRSKVFSEFMEGVEGAVINRLWINAVLANPPAYVPGPKRYFCDFAAGGDENVIAEREGNRVRIKAAWREKDTMRACGQFIDHFRRLELSQDDVARFVFGDGGGLGKPMLDRLAELGWRLNRVHNNAKASDPKAYKNLAAEMWFEAGKLFQHGRVILELDASDDRTIDQLTSRIGFAPSDGVMEVESKEEMRARGLDSPDRADAIVGALRDTANMEVVNFMGSASGNRGTVDQLMDMIAEGGLAEIPGAFAG
ncbi:hypothetical protein OpiT1DRAFT_05290 [Opitutaceae bacterium TAV1]|nr:hypothetical protein OpiT1DRAFT_05290 [Opitutaceae bacterium TAV1]